MSAHRNPYHDAARLPVAGTAARDATDLVDVRALVSGRSLELEIGPGPKAGFLVERAAAAPEAGLIGLEIRLKWAAVGDARLAKLGYGDRARVFAEDARRALPRLVPSGSIDRVFLHFPDPWWKKRHQKRLVMGDTFLLEVARLLRPNGQLFIQTDVEERRDLYERLVAVHPEFVPEGESPRVDENPFHARTPREHRAIADGLPIHRLLWRRSGE